jgi:tetratricopeptide (TPR) repeat protein
MRVRRLSRLGVIFLFLLLVASGYAGEVEQLLAAAEQAEQGGQLDVAAELYHRAAAIQPENFNLQYAVGLHCVMIENWPEAEEHLKKTLSLRPDFAPAHLNLGVVYSQNGQREEARRAFRLSDSNGEIMEHVA